MTNDRDGRLYIVHSSWLLKQLRVIALQKQLTIVEDIHHIQK